jgi:hypothetical protein
MTESKRYTGGCHCGQVRYEVELALERVYACNCSICSKTGSLLTFVPKERFTLLSGEDALGDYQFYKQKVHHHFCRQCGIRSFCRGTDPAGHDIRAINVRCLDDVDVDALTVEKVDGRSL